MELKKQDLLAYLARLGETDARTVARAFGVTYSVAAMRLLRLLRQGLATRGRLIAGRLYCYRLSERGQSRLDYFQRRVNVRNDTDLVERNGESVEQNAELVLKTGGAPNAKR